MPGDVGVGIYDGTAGLDTLRTFPGTVTGPRDHVSAGSRRVAAIDPKQKLLGAPLDDHNQHTPDTPMPPDRVSEFFTMSN